MVCRQCNTEIGNQRFCPNCGTEVAMAQPFSQHQTQYPSYNEAVPQGAPADAFAHDGQDGYVSTPPVNQSNYGQQYGVPTPNSYGAPQNGYDVYGQQYGTPPSNSYGTPQGTYDPYVQQNQYQQYLPNNNQQQYGYQGNTTPVVEDPGKGKATGALVCGILALFFGWLPGVIALILASQYAKVGNGNGANNAKAGKIMAWIGIGFNILAVLICVIVFIGVLSAFSSTTGFIGLL
jgi:hypothetical protein